MDFKKAEAEADDLLKEIEAAMKRSAQRGKHGKRHRDNAGANIPGAPNGGGAGVNTP